MRHLRAILLLVIYSTFTVLPAFARPMCLDACAGNKAVVHNLFGEATAPGECTEKEAVNSQFSEHRSGAVVKFTLTGLTQPRNLRTPIVPHPSAQTSFNTLTPDFTRPCTPLYISHCVYRL